MTPSMQPIAQRVKRVTVTVPATGSNAVILRDLMVAALNARSAGEGAAEAPYIMGGRIWKVATSYVVGDGLTDLPCTVAIGDVYEEPAANFAADTWLKSSAGSFTAAVTIYLTRRL